MKKLWKEIIILLIQLFMFYLFPLFTKSTEAMVMVFLILATTFILSILYASISKEKWKYFYPIIVAILFIPSVFIYYNISALIHTIWYLVDSTIGFLIGLSIYKITNT